MKRVRRSAFTLVELVIVITLFALMAAVVAPRLVTGYTNSEQRSGLRRMLSFVRTARETAILTASPVTVTVNADGRLEMVQTANDEEQALGAFRVPDGLQLTDPRPTSSQTGEESSVTFFADGSASGGDFLFDDGSGVRRALRVESATGAVEWTAEDATEEEDTWAAGELQRRG